MIKTSCEKTNDKNIFRVIVWNIYEDGSRSIGDIAEGELEWVKDWILERYSAEVSVLNHLTEEYEVPEFMSLIEAWESCADQHERQVHKPYRLVLKTDEESVIYEKELGQHIPNDINASSIIKFRGERYVFSHIEDYRMMYMYSEEYELED